jgi:aminocarboxymuconate-semialdehyde decarboxylase
MFGTDYPFPLGEQKMGHLVTNATSLDAETKQKILADNAKQFFSL